MDHTATVLRPVVPRQRSPMRADVVAGDLATWTGGLITVDQCSGRQRSPRPVPLGRPWLRCPALLLAQRDLLVQPWAVHRRKWSSTITTATGMSPVGVLPRL